LKTEKEFFEGILADYDLKPEQVVFIDDKQRFVDTAESVGINAILYESPEKLINDLKKLGIEL